MKTNSNCMTNFIKRPAFTLFELVLAVALSAALLALIGAAINLYLLECDANRLRVEEAQLARVVLDRIAADVHSVLVNHPQDMFELAEQMAGAAADSAGDSTSSFGSDSNASGSSSEEADSDETDASDVTEAPPALLLGNQEELLLDTDRLAKPRTWYLAEVADLTPAGSSRTVRWAVRDGQRVAGHDVLTTGLATEEQSSLAGLVRQHVPRAVRLHAGDDTGQIFGDFAGELLAPEVRQIEFRYLAGRETFDYWDSRESQALPQAIVARIWIESYEDNGESQQRDANLRPYSLTIRLPQGGDLPVRADESDGSGGSR